MKILLLIIFSIALVGCQKNSFDSCVDFYEKTEKRKSPDNWREQADISIQFFCRPGD